MNRGVASVFVSGICPQLAVKADHLPARSETGIGALMPWANRLWFVTYVSHKRSTGAGTGLFSIDDGWRLHRHPQSVVGTYADRMIHHESHQLILGPYIIDPGGRVRLFQSLVDIRLAAVCRHLKEPDKKVYFLGMEGEFLEADVRSLKTRFLFDLTRELRLDPSRGIHFKDAFCEHGRVVVANNSYYERDFAEGNGNGCLAEWDGTRWQVIARTQFNTTAGRVASPLGSAIYAVGQDKASALLLTYRPETGWRRWRLPKGTHTQDHAWTTEWPRLREVESERWLLDASGLFYELAAMTYEGHLWGVQPICRHLRIIPDFCSWNGYMVLGGNQTTPIGDQNPVVGQPQANLWFGKTDDLWSFGKPQGWGGPWRRTPVKAGEPSDPFLMTGFAFKGLHVSHDAPVTVTFQVEVDVLGDGSWTLYDRFSVRRGGALHHAFPPGFGAHWVRVVASRPCLATAQWTYT